MGPARSQEEGETTKHFIGIDVGTSSARACIVDEIGHIKALAVEKIQTWQPQPDHYEQSTTDIWNCISSCVRKAVKEAAIDITTIKGIGFDATCSLAVFNDEDEPVTVTGPAFVTDESERNVILWLDHRAKLETDEINGTGHSVLKYVGGQMSVEMEVPKILWLKNNMPASLFKRCKFYDLSDALTYFATDNEARSFCSVICKQGFMPCGISDDTNIGWQEDFLSSIGLEDLVNNDFQRLGGINGLNGKFLSAGEFVGYLSPRATEQFGLPAGIKVAVGSGVIDAYAGWIGTVGTTMQQTVGSSHLEDDPNTDSDIPNEAFSRLAVVAGTSTCHIAMSNHPIFVPGVWGPYRDILSPGMWFTEGGQSATGELLRYIVEMHPAFAQAAEQAKAQTSIYDYLNQHLEQLAKQQQAPTISFLGRHFFFYGDLWGNRSPVANAEMKGAVVGLTACGDKSVDNLALWYYGAMEFIALQTRQIIEQMNRAGHSISGIYISGSQCQNPLLMHLLSTACSMPVLIPKYVNMAVVHGAAMLGAKAASFEAVSGKTESLWAIMDRMSKLGHLVEPSVGSEKQLLDTKYVIFLDQCDTQQRYRKAVNAMIEGWEK